MSKFKAHLFVCTNSPDKEGKCGHKNSELLRRQVKELASKQAWAKDVRINSAGCLGFCEHGIAAVLYPQNEWLLDLKESDSEKLLSLVAENIKA